MLKDFWHPHVKATNRAKGRKVSVFLKPMPMKKNHEKEKFKNKISKRLLKAPRETCGSPAEKKTMTFKKYH